MAAGTGRGGASQVVGKSDVRTNCGSSRSFAQHRRQPLSLWLRQIARAPASSLRRNQMNSDDFEKRLQRQPLRQVPREWRAEIVQGAEAATRKSSWLSLLTSYLSPLLWPHPKPWAGL